MSTVVSTPNSTTTAANAAEPNLRDAIREALAHRRTTALARLESPGSLETGVTDLEATLNEGLGNPDLKSDIRNELAELRSTMSTMGDSTNASAGLHEARLDWDAKFSDTLPTPGGTGIA